MCTGQGKEMKTTALPPHTLTDSLEKQAKEVRMQLKRETGEDDKHENGVSQKYVLEVIYFRETANSNCLNIQY